jgi:hypothetical protein
MFLTFVVLGSKGCPQNSFISNFISEDFVKYELTISFCFVRKECFGKPG